MDESKILNQVSLQFEMLKKSDLTGDEKMAVVLKMTAVSITRIMARLQDIEESTGTNAKTH